MRPHRLPLVIVVQLLGCGDDAASGTTASGTGEGTSSGSGSGSSGSSESGGSSSEGSSSTGPMRCESDEECTEAEAPFCGLSGECGTCAGTKDPDGACAGVDPFLPLCVGEACVACTAEDPVVCDEQLLLCDGPTNACVPCTEHGQCGSGACELGVGTCFPEDLVVHVDGDGGQDFMDVEAAVAAVGAGGYGVLVVHEQDGDDPYTGAVLLDGGKHIALLAAPAESPILQGTGTNPGLRVEGAGTVLYMDGLRVSQGTGLGLRVSGAYAWVDRSRIVQNSGGGVVAEAGAELVLRNCFVGGNVEANVVELQGATAEVLYSTLGAGLGVTTSLACDAPSTVTVRNSLITSRSADVEVVCTGLDASYTAAEALLDGTSNVALGDMDVAWFDGFNAGDFGLTAMHPAAVDTSAQWTVGDPPTDIDGDPRPAVDGTPDFAGADVP